MNKKQFTLAFLLGLAVFEKPLSKLLPPLSDAGVSISEARNLEIGQKAGMKKASSLLLIPPLDSKFTAQAPQFSQADLQLLSAKILNRMLSARAEKDATPDGQISDEILQAGEELAQFADAIEVALRSNPLQEAVQIERTALSFYRSCAKEINLPESVRASCYVELAELAEKNPQLGALNGLNLPPRVLIIAEAVGLGSGRRGL